MIEPLGQNSSGSGPLRTMLVFQMCLTLSVWGGIRPPPHKLVSRVKNFVDCLIYVSKDYIPNLRPLGHIVHVEKFVVGGVGGSEQHVLTVILVLSLRPKLNNKKSNH